MVWEGEAARPLPIPICGFQLKYLHFFFNTAFQPVFLFLEIISGLKVKPEALRKSKIAGKPECCVGGY